MCNAVMVAARGVVWRLCVERGDDALAESLRAKGHCVNFSHIGPAFLQPRALMLTIITTPVY